MDLYIKSDKLNTNLKFLEKQNCYNLKLFTKFIQNTHDGSKTFIQIPL